MSSLLKLAIYLYSLCSEISRLFVVKLHTCVSACGLVCVWVGVHKCCCMEFFLEQTIYSPPEGLARRESDGSCVVVNKREDELSLVN